MKSNFLKFTMLAVTLIGAFIAGQVVVKRCSREIIEPISTKTVVKHDTVYDTVTVVKPVEVEKYIEGSMTAKVVTMVKHDTLYKDSIVEVELPKEVKVYKDSTYEAQVSGYNPQLDYIKVYPRTITTTVEKTIVTQKKQKWSDKFRPNINVSGGYGLINRQFDVYVGAGIAYTF